ncbi:tail fiber domain-containing protein [uncultured Pontibacter sp.]|uniref:tail fiber domain-containing protein n=1 Tax=uncultured Pontibacter sp. TaxID=453356 RepID=UPI0026090F71|nr:tail fiber domain-containing protein [uncultured Pontibacter sp.]
MALDFALRFKRQYADSIDADFRMTTAQREAYLNSPLKYAGMPVFDTTEGKPYYLSAGLDSWIAYGTGSTSTWESILNKPVTFTPSVHEHTWSEITSKPTTFTPSAHSHAWTEITSKPTTFAPSAHSHSAADLTSGTLVVTRGGTGVTTLAINSFLIGNGTAAMVAKTPAEVLTIIGAASTTHTHSINDIPNLASELAGKASTLHTHTWDDITLKPDFAMNGHSHSWSEITLKPTAFTPSAHSHSATDITSGTLTVARGGTGLATVTTGNFLRGNGTGAFTQETPAQVRATIGAAAATHTHAISEVATLSTELAGKANTVHTHTWEDITIKPDFAMNGHSHSWSEITLKPTTFAPSVHTHSIADVTDLQTTLNGKAAAVHSHSISDVANLSAELLNKASSVHTHSWEDINPKPDFAMNGHTHTSADISGVIAVGKGGTGLSTVTAGNFLRGNGTGAFTQATPAQVLTAIGAASASHSHAIADVANLSTELLNKADSVHTHTWDDITLKPDFSVNGHTHSWNDITSKPTTFTPSTHTHTEIVPLSAYTIGTATATPRSFGTGFKHGFVRDTNGYPITYGKLMSFGSYTTSEDGGQFQILTPYSDVAGYNDGKPMWRVGLHSNRGWKAWETFASESWASSTFAPNVHTHSISDIANLSTELLNKANTIHTHTWDDITIKPDFAMNGHSHSWGEITSKPTTFTPASHNHSAADITSGTLTVARGGTGLATITTGNFLRGNGTGAMTQATPAQVLTAIGAAPATHTHAIDDVANLSTTLAGLAPAVHTHSWEDITIKPDFALNGHAHSWSEILSKPTTFAPSAHSHSAADISTGTLSVARGGTGLASYTAGNYIKATATTTLAQVTPAQVRTDIGAAAATHTHSISEVANLSTELLGKANTVHTHTWEDITIKPDFAMNGHTHSAGDITSGSFSVARGGTGMSTLTSGSYMRGNGTSAVTMRTPAQVLTDIGAAPASHAHTWGDIADKPLEFNPVAHTHQAIDILGLDTSQFAAASHTHSATDITSGTFSVARGGTGRSTLGAGTYLVGAGTASVSMIAKTSVLADIGGAPLNHTHPEYASSTHTHPEYVTSTDILNETRYRHAQNSITGGGTVTWNGSHLKWTQRFIAIPVDKSIGGNGYIDFAMPNSGVVIQGLNGAASVTVTSAGVPLDDWTALIAFHTIAGSNTAVSYRVMRYNQSTANALHAEHFVIAVRSGESSGNPVKLANGFTLRSGNSLVDGQFGSTTFNGDIWASGQVTAFSDARLKTKVKPYEGGLVKVMQLRPVTYDRTDIESDDEIGFIAQEVQQIEPNLVKESEFLALDYSRMVVMLTKAVQEQQKLIEGLQAEVEKLKGGR